MKILGPTFGSELIAAGLGGLPIVWGANDATIVAPTLTAAQAATLAQVVASHQTINLVDYASAARYAKEVGGITIAGVPVATDDRSKLMIIGARVAADADPTWATEWQGADGGSYPINAAAMIAISNAVQAHVAACFATFASVKAAIAAGTVTTTAAIDAAFA